MLTTLAPSWPGIRYWSSLHWRYSTRLKGTWRLLSAKVWSRYKTRDCGSLVPHGQDRWEQIWAQGMDDLLSRCRFFPVRRFLNQLQPDLATRHQHGKHWQRKFHRPLETNKVPKEPDAGLPDVIRIHQPFQRSQDCTTDPPVQRVRPFETTNEALPGGDQLSRLLRKLEPFFRMPILRRQVRRPRSRPTPQNIRDERGRAGWWGSRSHGRRLVSQSFSKATDDRLRATGIVEYWSRLLMV